MDSALRPEFAASPSALGITNEPDTQDEVQLQNDQAVKELKEIAALHSHPGWQAIRAILEEQIDNYRSGRTLSMVMQDVNLTDEELGRRMRSATDTAKELGAILQTVDIAVAEVDKEQQEARNARASERTG